MQYPHAIQALTVHAYNHTVKYFVPGGVNKGHLTALGLSFLEVTYFMAASSVTLPSPGRRSARHTIATSCEKTERGARPGWMSC